MQQGLPSQVVNARRPPAHLSVSIRREMASPASSACSLKAQGARAEEARHSGAAWRPSPVPRSSAESNVSTNSHMAPAEKWFNRSNNNVEGRSAVRFIDNDPPFFLQTKDCSDLSLPPNMDGLLSRPRAFVSATQFASDNIPMATDGSSVDDFRSVIDDLTIENKRLKDKLRKYKTPSGSHLEQDKLFEVNVHGLTPRKKRELEEILHTFASNISKDGSTESTNFPKVVKANLQPVSRRKRRSKKSPSPSTSNSQQVDSAYASLSMSGPMSLSTSNLNGGGASKGGILPAKSKMGKVQSFLDEIPQGVLPKHSTVMTERGKKKLVVRRLEQIFTGRVKVPVGVHSQPQQQQEVSNSAARNDRQAIESRGLQVTAEGVREAHIFDINVELERAKVTKLVGESSIDPTSASQSEVADRGRSNSTSPNQRPTRPSDLDPDRPQVPADNMNYIRHLGISTPDMALEDSNDMPSDVDGHGWVYLNLLMNLAQLHIINVTTDFVRLAVTELSTKFQLSPDGRKIRWRGGSEGTELSSDSGGDNFQRQSLNDSNSLDESSRKRRKIDVGQSQAFINDQFLNQAGIFAQPIPASDKARNKHVAPPRPDLSYRPLYARRSSGSDDWMSVDQSSSLGSYVAADESGAGHVTSGVKLRGKPSQSGLSSKKPRVGGAIAFYHGGDFCTDLSGDFENIPTPLHLAADFDGFSSHSHDALGCQIKSPSRKIRSRTASGSVLGFRPFKNYPICDSTRSQTPDVVKLNDSDYFNFSPLWTDPGQQSHNQLKLDACGLGGTRPADRFIVTVETKRTKLDRRTLAKLSKFSAPSRRCLRFLHKISKSSLDTFSLSDEESVASQLDSLGLPPGPNLRSEIVSARITHHRPSDLPPPSTYHVAFSSSTDWSEGTTSSDSEQEAEATSPERPPGLLYGPISHHSVDRDVDLEQDEIYRSGDVSSTDDSETSSIDMLAHLRRIHPETIAAKEAEFDEDLAMAPIGS